MGTAITNPDARRRARPGRSLRPVAWARSASAGQPPPTTSASSATTSTARPPPGSRRRPRTASRSQPGRATSTAAWPGTYYYKVAPKTHPATRPCLERGHRHCERRHDAAHGTLGLAAAGSSGQVALTWTAASDAGGIARYNVHRSTTAASRRRRRTASLSPRRRATPIRASQQERTSTGSLQTTTPGTQALPRTKRRRRSRPGRHRARRRMGLRCRERHDGGRPVRERQHRHAHERDLVDQPASSATR